MFLNPRTRIAAADRVQLCQVQAAALRFVRVPGVGGRTGLDAHPRLHTHDPRRRSLQGLHRAGQVHDHPTGSWQANSQLSEINTALVIWISVVNSIG